MERLLAKYYAGETSLEEEKLVRKLLTEVQGYGEEKMFFHGLEAFKNEEPEERPAPRAGKEMGLWRKVAAVAAVFIAVTWLFIDHQKQKEEALAYEKVMDALSMIQENMQKGTIALQAMEDMRHLDKTNELFNIKSIKEEEK